MLLALSLLPGCHAQEKPPHVISQSLAVILDPGSHSLAGTATYSLIRRSAGVIRFDLSPRAKVLAVREGERNLPFTFSDGRLSVSLSPFSPGSRIDIAITYRGTFNDVPEQTLSFEDPTFGITGIIGSEGIFLGSEAGWYPEPSPLPNERVVTITVPPGFHAITGGERIAGRGAQGGHFSVWRVSAPGERLALSAGPYQVAERQLDGIVVATYLFPDTVHLSERYLAASIDHLRFYQGMLGPYPFKKFAVVENFLPTGYGFPSYTLMGGEVLRLPFIADTSLPHEIVHCWWGNGVRVDYRQGNWSEGLATYLADHFMEERKSPSAAVEYRRRLLADYAFLVSPSADFPLNQFVGRVDPASRAIGYGKGAMLFHMVRLEIGDKAFFQGLRDMIQDKLFKKVAWSDFIHTFSATSGRDLTPFFLPWLQRPGGPRLAIRNVTVTRDRNWWRVTGIVEQSAPVYAFPLSLRLENTADPVTITVPVKEERTRFSITALGKPRRLMLDPDADLFRLLSPDELPPTVNRVKGSRNLAAIRTPDCRIDSATFSRLLTSLGHGDVRIREEEEVSPPALARHDLLVCGVPRRQELAPDFAGAVSPAAGSFTAGSAAFADPGDALFAVGRSRLDSGRVAALFLPLSAAAASDSLPKITHYGKYGYLAFHRGKNMVKGSLPAQGDDTVVTFTGADNE